jgi:hypothetical protein
VSQTPSWDQPQTGGELGLPPPPAGPQEDPPGATAALVCGILGLFVLPLILSVAALVLGYKARGRAKADPQRYKTGRATTGIVLGWIGVAVIVAGVFLLTSTDVSFAP